MHHELIHTFTVQAQLEQVLSMYLYFVCLEVSVKLNQILSKRSYYFSFNAHCSFFAKGFNLIFRNGLLLFFSVFM